jgi:ABC-type lipoprotein export system ATPase subunit
LSLRVEDLSHTYQSTDPRTILHPQSWSLDDGQQVLVRGISGSGKTTLFNILAGLLRPTSGSVYYGEQSLYRLSEAARDRFRARHLGYIFQSHHLIPSLSALENVVAPIAFARILPRGQWRIAAQALLDKLGVGAWSRSTPRQLSTGQRLRVAVARALVTNPRVVLADEPTAALDESSAVTVMDTLQQTCQDNGAILIVASHDPALTARFTTTAALQDGHLSWEALQTA